MGELNMGEGELKSVAKLAMERTVAAGEGRLKTAAEVVNDKIIEMAKKEKEIEDSISQASSFEELCAVMEKIGGLKGTSGFSYTPEGAQDLIRGVQEGRLPIDYVTRAGGLREKVKELLNAKSERFSSNGEVEKVESAEKLIGQAQSFDELYAVLKKIGGIPGSNYFFDAERTRDFVDRIKRKEEPLSLITRTNGLRSKVGELLELEEARKNVEASS